MARPVGLISAGASGKFRRPVQDSDETRSRANAFASRLQPQHSGLNAADLYKHAIGLFEELTEAERQILKQHFQPGRMKAEDAAALSEKIQPIMDLLREARKAGYADWGVGNAGFDVPMNYIAKAQEIGQLAYWEAGYRFQGDPAGAVLDLAAREALGRSVDDSALGFLVNDSFNATALSLIAQNAGRIPPAAYPDLAGLTDTTETVDAFAIAMEGEAAMVQNLVDRFNDPATRSQIMNFFHDQNGEKLVGGLSKAKQLDLLLGTTLQSDAEYEAQYENFKAQNSGNSLLMQSLESLNEIRSRASQELVEKIMVVAGLAMLTNNPQQFASAIDPSTGKPFTYTASASGFQLSSPTLLPNHKPLSLSFSTPSP